MADFTPIISIAIILYCLAEILKRTVLKSREDLRAVIPYVCAIIGAVGAAAMFAIDPELVDGASNIRDAIVSGAFSGLLATGANQVYKQFFNLFAIGKSITDEVNEEVANMTTEEKKDYITSVAAEMVTDILNKANGVDEDSTTEETSDTPAEESAESAKSSIVTEVPDTDIEASANSTKPY